MRRIRRIFKQVVAVILSVAYFTTQGGLAQAAEAHFWFERWQAARRLREIHSLTSAFTVYEGSRPALWTGLESPSFLKKLPAAAEPSAYLSRLMSALSAHGAVRSLDISSSENSPIVVVLQDAHGNLSAQENLSSMILDLWDLAPDAWLGVESAVGDIDLSRWRGPFRAVNEKIARFFLRAGLIAGPEAAGLSAARLPRMTGLEDRALYRRHAAAARESWRLRAEWKAVLAGWRQRMGRLKVSSYAPALLELDKRIRARDAGENSLPEHLLYLATHPQAPGLASFPQAALFSQAYGAEKSLDSGQVERGNFWNCIACRRGNDLSIPIN